MVPIESPVALAAVLATSVGLSLWLCDRYRWAERVSALVLILLMTATCSNLGWIPSRASMYGAVSDFCVPFAVCLVLFGVRLRALASLRASVLVAFVVASAASLAGVMGASLALAGWLEGSIGPEHWKLAGPYAGTYVGGSLNFFAMWEGLNIDRPDLFAAANAVDNLTILPLMLVWTSAPRWLGRFFPMAAWAGSGEGDQPVAQGPTPFRATDLALLSAMAIVVIALSEWTTTHWIKPIFPQVPSILLVTTFALGIGQLPFVRRLQGAWDLGYLAFYFFFAAVGAGIDLMGAVELSPILFGYVGIVFVVHMLVLFGAGRLLGLDLGLLVIASTATKGGPTLVPSVAKAHGWTALVLPGILLGLLGYAVGNYLGFATAYLVKAML